MMSGSSDKGDSDKDGVGDGSYAEGVMKTIAIKGDVTETGAGASAEGLVVTVVFRAWFTVTMLTSRVVAVTPTPWCSQWRC